MGPRLKAVVGMVALVAALGACSGGDSDRGVAAGGGGDAPAAQPQREAAYGRSEDALGTATGSTGGMAALDTSLPPVGPAVIKTGDLRLRVEDDGLQAALSGIVDVARAHGGFVLSTSVEEQGARSATVIVRIPAEAFEDALADARDVGEVEREQVSGEDVSQEFVDLEARLRNFEAQESVLLDLMAKSSSVADTLRVQRELQDVQLEIERLRGRLRYLRDQTDLSTITIALRESDPVVAGTGLIERAWNRSVDTFNAIVSAIVVGLSVAIPLSLLLVLLLVIARLVRPHLPSWGARNP